MDIEITGDEEHYPGNLSNHILFDLILDSVSDIVGLQDADSRVIYMSPSVEKTLGYKPADVVGQRGGDYAYIDDLPIIKQASEDLVTKKEALFEYRCRHKDGHYIWLENKMRVITNDTTGELNTIFVARDISHRKAIEANLEISEKRFKTIFNSPLVGVSVTDRDGRWIIVNEFLCRLLGYSKQELLKLKWQDLTPQPDCENELIRYRSVLENRSSGIVFEKKYTHRDGSIIHTAVSAMSMFDNRGDIDGFINVITNISDNVKAYNEISEIHRQMHNLLGNLSGMAFRGLNDNRWTMLFLSDGCLELTGFTPQEIIEDRVTDFNEITHPDDRIWVHKHIDEAIAEHKRYQLTYRIIDRNGEIKWVWEQGNGVYADTKLKFLEGFITDVTASKVVENRLFDAAKEMANLNHMKDKFFSIIAHDLKNPIYAIISLSEFLGNQIGKIEQKRQTEIIGDIHTSALNVYSLLDNLLEWAKTQTGGLECNTERVSLQKLISECVQYLKHQADSKNIRINLTCKDRVIVLADYRMLSTALRNILSNAVKFTHKNGEVEIGIESTGIFTKIIVKDNGIGMSREQKEQIFRIDTRNAKTGTENEPGNGLGLILSKELIEKHNGTITVESRLGKGSTFIISIPQIRD